jgi:hypothetical protein
MKTILASTHPEMVVNVHGSDVDGRTYFDVLQDAVDYYAFGQEETGFSRMVDGAMKTMVVVTTLFLGLVASVLVYAEAGFVKGVPRFFCTVPQFVIDELDL